MQGLGIDKEAVYSAFSGRTKAQVADIEKTYKKLFSRDLNADLRDELTDSEMKTLALQSPEGKSAVDRYELVANQLNQAMDRIGTDETQIYSALTGRSKAERTAIQAAYKKLTGRNVVGDLRSELSGDELIEAIRLFNQDVLNPEDEIFLAMSGAGTDEARIERVMNKLRGDAAAIAKMDAEYRKKYGNVIADLCGDLSGDNLKGSLDAVGPTLPNTAFEDCNPTQIKDLRAAVPPVEQELTRATQVLGKGTKGMNAAEKSTFTTYFDRSNSGYDQRFLNDVLSNFRSLRRDLDARLTFECETATGRCDPSTRVPPTPSSATSTSAHTSSILESIAHARSCTSLPTMRSGRWIGTTPENRINSTI